MQLLNSRLDPARSRPTGAPLRAPGRRSRRRGLPPGLGFTLPACLFVLAFMAYPLANLLYLSVHAYAPLRSDEVRFVGAENYSWLLRSDEVRESLMVTLAFTVTSVALEVVLGLALATLLARQLIEARGRLGRLLAKLCSSVFILPFAAPAVAAAIAWKMLLHPQFGPVNAALGVEIAWFTDYPLPAVVVADAWKTLPLVLFLLLAAILSIEPEQFEAAQLDGASFWQETRYLTVPSILPVLAVTTAFRAVDAFTKIFDTVYITTGGGPGRDTQVFPLLIWKTAFSHLNFGQAAALAVVAIVIALVLGGPLLRRSS
jgi:ABC-type sugar transport system permease subunit